jgi:hypothetical protein
MPFPPLLRPRDFLFFVKVFPSGLVLVACLNVV